MLLIHLCGFSLGGIHHLCISELQNGLISLVWKRPEFKYVILYHVGCDLDDKARGRSLFKHKVHELMSVDERVRE